MRYCKLLGCSDACHQHIIISSYQHFIIISACPMCAMSIMPAQGASGRGPGGPASRWASLTLGVLGLRVRGRRGKGYRKSDECVGEVGSVEWVQARLLSRASPSSKDVPVPSLPQDAPDPGDLPLPNNFGSSA